MPDQMAGMRSNLQPYSISHFHADECSNLWRVCRTHVGCHTWIRQESFRRLSETFPLSRDHSPSITLIKSERGLSKKKLDVLLLMHLCCIPILKEWPFCRGWEESIHSHSSASLMQECAWGPAYASPAVAWKLQCHKATGVGQDPILIHVWDKLM